MAPSRASPLHPPWRALTASQTLFPSDDWASWPSQSLFLPQINAAINKRTQSQSPLCLKRRATFPHTGPFVWSNLLSSVWGHRPAVGPSCLTNRRSLLLCLLGRQNPGCGWYLPFGDFQRCRPDGRQPRVDLGAWSCQDRFPSPSVVV